MMQCGMFVTADSYRANVSAGLYIHFIREEDATMTSGHLEEELARMSTIAPTTSDLTVSFCLTSLSAPPTNGRAPRRPAGGQRPTRGEQQGALSPGFAVNPLVIGARSAKTPSW